EQVEIFCHGGRQTARLILDELITSGARVAEPGEFTRLGFLSGRMDLTKAEAVADIIAASTTVSHNVAREQLLGKYAEHVSMLRSRLVDILVEVEVSIDYPEEEITPENKRSLLQSISDCIELLERLVDTYRSGRIIREGFKVAIGGRPNAGKSSLFNLLLKQERALVTATPGTTRDYISEWIDLNGVAVNIIDTAGLRQTRSRVEKVGQDAARKIFSGCDLLIWIVDLSRKGWRRTLKEDLKQLENFPIWLVGNKIDLLNKGPAENEKHYFDDQSLTPVSCLTSRGMKRFRQLLDQTVNQALPDLTSGVVVTSARHRQKLIVALRYVKKTRKKVRIGDFPELIVFELKQALNEIDEITGKIYNEEILDRIFSKFCIGK
ncbi:MAG: tRNA uridine-5-carboxymethylaminomethyl(34) synthesis GTPase MnmE, partial [candidate division Zixibacteria bacterium]|nr:tRNA uridine-5-carboxymethylaminomethyl(34) synthesis GTPase MnmE [candidate division Zixibacteria bacterium]